MITLGRCHVIAALIALMLCGACNTREAGCLDIDATNFDFTAEKNDPATCVYPDLILNVEYAYGLENLSPGNTYVNFLDQAFVLESFYVMLSQFAWSDETTQFQVRDLIDWTLKEPTGTMLQVPDDFSLVDRSTFNYRLGEMRNSGLQQNVRFSLGVPDTLTPVCLDSLEENHVLRSTNVQYDEVTSTFASARLVINRDTSGILLDTLFVYTQPHAYDYMLNKEFVQGQHDTIKIIVDFESVLGNIDLTQPIENIESELADVVNLAVRDNN